MAGPNRDLTEQRWPCARNRTGENTSGQITTSSSLSFPTCKVGPQPVCVSSEDWQVEALCAQRDLHKSWVHKTPPPLDLWQCFPQTVTGATVLCTGDSRTNKPGSPLLMEQLGQTRTPVL